MGRTRAEAMTEYHYVESAGGPAPQDYNSTQHYECVYGPSESFVTESAGDDATNGYTGISPVMSGTCPTTIAGYTQIGSPWEMSTWDGGLTEVSYGSTSN